MVSTPRSGQWVGLSCNLCDYSVLSPDTTEGLKVLYVLHLRETHPHIRWTDSKGRVHGGGSE